MARRSSRRGSTLTPLGVWVAWFAVLGLGLLLVWIWWNSGRPLGGGRSGPEGAGVEGQRTGVVARSRVARMTPKSESGSLSNARPAEVRSGGAPLAETAPVVATNSLVPTVAAGAGATGVVSSIGPIPLPLEGTSTVSRVGLPAGPQTREQLVAIQMALARRGISAGPIDGVLGSQTRSALRVFQRENGIPISGVPDAATLKALRWESEGFDWVRIGAEDLARLTPVPKTWLGKASSPRLDYESLLELVAERAQTHPRLIRQLNPGIDWLRVRTGAVVRVPAVASAPVKARAARVRISLGEKTLRVYDDAGVLMAHFPCSIARRVEKRPVGELRVVKLAPNPNYRFDPEIFRDSEEARRIGRKLMIPPGPNNPVGTAWIGLDRPGYGIHGTPHPEDVGRTESHGCFRLANWNAERLLRMAWVGMPVQVEP